MAGQPANITHIVPANTILTVQAMSVEELGPLQLGLMLQGNTNLQVEWLARRRLLRNTHQCIRYGIVSSRRAARCRRWVPMEVSTLRGEAEHLAPLFLQEQPSTRETCVAVVQLDDGDRHVGRDVAR